MTPRRVPAWPLLVLALPAGVSIWAGWVGLGQMTGFGVVPLLPGIWDELRINTAITLPIGMECYGAYALRAWLTQGTPPRARQFAKCSALGALMLGTLGQIAYHLMAAAGVTAAPWVVTMLVSCLPVAVLGMGAALYHLLTDEPEPPAPVSGPVTPPAGAPVAVFRPGGVSGYPVAASIRPAGQPETAPPPRPGVAPAFNPARGASVPPADRIQPGSAPVTNPSASTEQSVPVAGERVSKSRTDAQLSQAVRDLTRRNGGTPPSQYQLRHALGIGSGRAARLLAELDTTTPAAAAVVNGAARKEGTR
ncbi:MAG: hypothetical protein ACRDTG_14165 [Pseudonocardiaceae bacterium]